MSALLPWVSVRSSRNPSRESLGIPAIHDHHLLSRLDVFGAGKLRDRLGGHAQQTLERPAPPALVLQLPVGALDVFDEGTERIHVAKQLDGSHDLARFGAKRRDGDTERSVGETVAAEAVAGEDLVLVDDGSVGTLATVVETDDVFAPLADQLRRIDVLQRTCNGQSNLSRFVVCSFGQGIDKMGIEDQKDKSFSMTIRTAQDEQGTTFDVVAGGLDLSEEFKGKSLE